MLARELREDVLATRSVGWFEDPDFVTKTANVARAVKSGEVCPTPSSPPDSESGQRERAAITRGIDKAFATLNPVHGGGAAPIGLQPHAVRLDLDGRFNSDADDGVLLPRVAWPRDERLFQPLTVRELFHSLTFVPAAATGRGRLESAPFAARLARDRRAAGLTVACVPAIEDAAELRIRAIERDDKEWYRADLEQDAVVRARIATVVAAISESAVDLAVMPEFASSPAVLALWQDLLPSAARPPLWVMTGTGDHSARDGPRVNAAVLVDGASGEQLVRQDKQFPFDIPVAAQNAQGYPLGVGTGRSTLHEDIEPGYGLTFLDVGAARVAILICEDLTRVVDLVPSLVAFGVSHVITPVFSRPCKPRRWAQNAATSMIKESGATVVVANSLVVGRLVERATGASPAGGPIYTAVAINPWGARSQRTSAPDQLARFLLKDDEEPVPLDDP